MPQLLLERPREGFDLFCLELRYWRRLRLGPCDRGIELRPSGTLFLRRHRRRKEVGQEAMKPYGEGRGP